MPGVVSGSYRGVLGQPFKMPSVHEYRSGCLLGKIRSQSLEL
jgi:hypothetical protein